MVSAASMVPRLWVMTMNWVSWAASRRAARKRSTLASSSAASTSSRMQKGGGLTLRMARISAAAVRLRSPPLSSGRDCTRLPGGRATMSMPLPIGSSGSVSCNWAVPPPKSVVKRSLNSRATAR